MSIAETVTMREALAWTLSLAVLILGWLACSDLPCLGDPPLTDREVRVITPYPGASAAEVEVEVSQKVETVVRQLAQLGWVESCSSRGLSVVGVHIRDKYDEQALPQIWDELRHRIDDLQSELPPGAGPSRIDDRIGDISGAYYALVGAGFTPAELAREAEVLRLGLSTLDGVEKVDLFGEQHEALYVEVSSDRAKALGVGLEQVIEALGNKDLPADAGSIRIGPEQVAISPSEVYRSEQELGELMIAPGPNRLVRLGDVAEIRRGYQDPPRLLRVEGQPAVGIAVAAKLGTDPIALGEAVQRRLSELTVGIPLGMELKTVALQSDAVRQAIEDSTGYLVQASLILVLALLLLMGPRRGLLVAFLTLVTLAATFLVMEWLGIGLDRVSLGALVIVSGLIPGSSILLVEDLKANMDGKMAGTAAAREVVARDALPLLAATAVTVLSFAPVAGMESIAGDYSRPLFQVISIALPLSWAMALTLGPLLADRFLGYGDRSGVPSPPPAGLVANDHGASRATLEATKGSLGPDRSLTPTLSHKGRGGSRSASGAYFHSSLYARILAATIRHRWILLSATVVMITLSLYGFGFIKQIYFPPSTSPRFLVEVSFRAGTAIEETEHWMDEIQAYLRGQEGIRQVATAIGAGHPRYVPGYHPVSDPGSHYAVSLVSVDDPHRIDTIGPRIQTDLQDRFTDAVVDVEREPRALDGTGGHILLRISGPDPVELRRMADQVEQLMAADPDAKAVRDDWGAKVKVARPVLNGELMRRLGVTRAQIAATLHATYAGSRTGLFQEGTELIPILVRAPQDERTRIEDMESIQVTSPLRGDKISLNRLVERLDTVTEDARRYRRNGIRVIGVQADTDRGSAFELLERLEPRVEEALGAAPTANASLAAGPDIAIPLGGRPGYTIDWGGEAEGLAASRVELLTWLPLCGSLILLILVALFRGLRQPLVILLNVPLVLIGIVTGLLLTGLPLDFLSLLGLMGLSGLVIRSAILLVERIDAEVRTGGAVPLDILRAVGARRRPVGFAAITSILTLLPLLQDGLFVSMAVTLVFGLAIATPLVLVVVPVLYSVLFRARGGEAPLK